MNGTWFDTSIRYKKAHQVHDLTTRKASKLRFLTGLPLVVNHLILHYHATSKLIEDSIMSELVRYYAPQV